MDPSSLDFATHTPDNYALLSFPEVYDHFVQENLLLGRRWLFGDRKARDAPAPQFHVHGYHPT